MKNRDTTIGVFNTVYNYNITLSEFSNVTKFDFEILHFNSIEDLNRGTHKILTGSRAKSGSTAKLFIRHTWIFLGKIKTADTVNENRGKFIITQHVPEFLNIFLHTNLSSTVD